MRTFSDWRTWLSTDLNLSPETVDCLEKRFSRVNLPADDETLEHSQRVTGLACQLAEKAGLPKIQPLVFFRWGALLHDLGKLLVPDEILAKPSALSSEDWAVVRRHPYFSYLLLCDIPELEPALDIPLNHHECWDGSGYPRGLKGAEIPLAARIYSIVDAWDALNSPRPYRPAFSPTEARDILVKLSGKHFDPSILDLFLEMTAVPQ